MNAALSTESRPVLELTNVCKSFGGLQATRNVSFRLIAGDRKAVIGPNGAGKTTLFNLVTGIFPTTSGQITLFGKNVTAWPPHRRAAAGISRTFQVTSLFPKLTVMENVLLAIQGKRSSKFVMWRPQSSYREANERALHLLDRMKFIDRKDMEVHKLSHGEQRQLEIIVGLAGDPQVLLLDEPAAGLSSGETAEMSEFLDALDPKLSVLLIEHDMDLVFEFASEITVLYFGEVLETGTADEIRNSRRVHEIYFGT